MPQPLPPAHLVIQQQIPSMQSMSQAAYLPNVHAMRPPAAQMAPYASAPAANASHMVLSTTPQQETEDSSPRSIARVQSVQSSAPSSARSGITGPEMSHRTPSEQAVIQALQAVANYPESREFVKTMTEQLPGLQNLLEDLVQAPVQIHLALALLGLEPPHPSQDCHPSRMKSWVVSEPRHMGNHQQSVPPIIQQVALPRTNASMRCVQ